MGKLAGLVYLVLCFGVPQRAILVRLCMSFAEFLRPSRSDFVASGGGARGLVVRRSHRIRNKVDCFSGLPETMVGPADASPSARFGKHAGLFKIGGSRFMVPTGIAVPRVACSLTSLGLRIGPRTNVTLSGWHIAFVGVASFAAAFFAGIGRTGRSGLGADKLDFLST